MASVRVLYGTGAVEDICDLPIRRVYVDLDRGYLAMYDAQKDGTLLAERNDVIGVYSL